jgi:hypothetical protein
MYPTENGLRAETVLTVATYVVFAVVMFATFTSPFLA